LNPNAKHILTVFTACLLCAGFFFSCGKGANNYTSDTDSDNSTAALVGTWYLCDNRCAYHPVGSVANVYDISTNTIIARESTYGDQNCSTLIEISEPHYSIEVIGNTDAPASAKKLNITVIKFLLTPVDEDLVESRNLEAYCGFTDWSANSSKDVTDKDCIVSWFPTSGTTFYDIYMVDESTDPKRLYFGDVTTGEMTSEANRPTSLQEDTQWCLLE